MSKKKSLRQRLITEINSLSKPQATTDLSRYALERVSFYELKKLRNRLVQSSSGAIAQGTDITLSDEAYLLYSQSKPEGVDEPELDAPKKYEGVSGPEVMLEGSDVVLSDAAYAFYQGKSYEPIKNESKELTQTKDVDDNRDS
jgi:hypothetical protein